MLEARDLYVGTSSRGLAHVQVHCQHQDEQLCKAMLGGRCYLGRRKATWAQIGEKCVRGTIGTCTALGHA